MVERLVKGVVLCDGEHDARAATIMHLAAVTLSVWTIGKLL
jgi:hypothetical protein